MEEIPIEEQIFTPNPLLVADLIFESPKPPKAIPVISHRRDSGIMNYSRHHSTDGGHQVHFEDGKTTTMQPHQPSLQPSPAAGPLQQYPQQPQAAYPLQQNLQPPFQQPQYFSPPPPQSGSAPIPIPIRSRARSNSHDAYPAAYPPAPYGISPNSSAIPPQTTYGTWPHPGYYPQQPQPTMPSQTEFPWQAQPGAGGYLPGPGPIPTGQAQPGGYYPPPPPMMAPRTGSNSSYVSRSSQDSSELDSDRHRHKHHHKHHHGSRTSSFTTHGDRADGKYSNHSDHASLADTLVLIWDGLSGGFGKPKRY